MSPSQASCRDRPRSAASACAISGSRSSSSFSNAASWSSRHCSSRLRPVANAVRSRSTAWLTCSSVADGWRSGDVVDGFGRSATEVMGPHCSSCGLRVLVLPTLGLHRPENNLRSDCVTTVYVQRLPCDPARSGGKQKTDRLRYVVHRAEPGQCEVAPGRREHFVGVVASLDQLGPHALALDHAH